ncbi:MAG: FAD-dependent oxidoreductase [Pseudomonadota bacterium]
MNFDYVIIGGGSAGSTLAARLSEDGKNSVCLLEAGGKGDGILHRAPAGILALVPGQPKIANWGFSTTPQHHLNGRKGYQPRGKALGGSSAINAMLYIRGHQRDYDEWAELGCDGWSWDDVRPYFLKSEKNQRGASDLHGGDGPLFVSEQQSPRQISRDFITAAGECQFRLNDDFNGPEQEGVGLYQVTQFHNEERNGERCSAAAAYLHPNMQRDNLTVITKAHVLNIELEGKRASGVRYKKNGKNETVKANQEVVLCGGSFNSPQLLMLSGIGPVEHLKLHGIEVRHNLPGVGENLQDHVDMTLAWETHEKDVFGIGFGPGYRLFKAALQWRKDGTGMVATPIAETGAFLKTDPDLDRPDIQLHFIIGVVDDHGRKLHWGNGFSIHTCVLRPKSVGNVGLRSSNPQEAPMIDPNFLSADEDMEVLLKSTKMIRKIVGAPSFKHYCGKEKFIDGPLEDQAMREHIKSRADTIYHPVGTCKMGTDEMAVVDPHLKVHGMENLRVVDASVMPKLIGGNTNAPTIMIAEKAADLIKESSAA